MVTQARNLVIDLDDAGAIIRYLVRDRDANFPALFSEVLTDAGIAVVFTGVRMQRMNAVMERRVRTCRSKLLHRMLIWNHAHMLHGLRHIETHCDERRPRRTSYQSVPLRPRLESITEQTRIIYLDIRRRGRLGGIPDAYEHAA